MEFPVDRGYSMPAEWEVHRSTWFVWPENEDTFPGVLENARSLVVQWIAALTADRPKCPSPREHADILVSGEDQYHAAKKALKAAGVEKGWFTFHITPTHDLWIRDFGPTFVTRRKEDRGEVAVIDWTFDGWGGRAAASYGYHPDLENKVPMRIAENRRMSVLSTDVIMEGGGFEVDGHGLAMTTKSFLEGRGHSVERGAAILQGYLGAQDVIVLDGVNIPGDHTDGHIDMIARFVGPREVLISCPDDRSHPLYDELSATAEELESFIDHRGRMLRVHRLPFPSIMREHVTTGSRKGEVELPATYANFFIGNTAVLVPTFGEETDEPARRKIASLFPEREVLSFDCRSFFLGGGGIHCASQQEPLPSP